VRSSAYRSRFRVQGLESGNVDPMRATLYAVCFVLCAVWTHFNTAGKENLSRKVLLPIRSAECVGLTKQCESHEYE
jgi:hypothetical protein